MSMGHSTWSTLRSYTRDGDVKRQKLAKGTARRILRYAGPYRRDITIFLTVTVLDAMALSAVPLVLKYVIDSGVTPGVRSAVIAGAVLVAVLAVLDAVFGLVGRWASARIGEGLIYDLRTEVFDHVQRQPVAFFTRTQTGSLVSRLNSDVVGAQQAFTSTLSSVVSNAITLVISLAAMLILSWQITVLLLLLVPLFVLPARLVGRRLADISRESMQLNASMSQTMTERFNVAGALLVKIFGRYSDDAAGFSRDAGRVRDIGIVQALYARFFFTGLTLLASLATALVYGLGGLLAIGGTLQVGTLVALAALLSRLYGPLTALSNVQVDVMTALVSFERVFEVLDLPPLVRDRPDAAPLPAGPATVEFDRVGFAYPTAEAVSLASLESVAVLDRAGGQQVLHDVSFAAPAGALVALVGPSGAGKSTMTHLVARLYDVDSGAVRVAGADVRDVTLDSLHAAVGVVTQEAHLFHDTIGANLRYAAPEATDEQLWAALEDAQIGDLMATLPDGLDTVVGDRGYRLSGGEKQRIALARLLLKAPRVVVLDEATAHLDSESELAVQRALDRALDGRTALVVAHRLSTVREADLILVVDDGRVVERGTHVELLAGGGLYSVLYRTQFASQEESVVQELTP